MSGGENPDKAPAKPKVEDDCVTYYAECKPGVPLEPGRPYAHPKAIATGTCSDGCCDRYKCPVCGTSFTVEAPD